MNLSFETKVQLGLVGVCAALTGLVIYEDRKIKTEMAKLLAANNGFVEIAARVVDSVEAGNKMIEIGNAKIEAGNKQLEDLLKEG